MKIIELFQNSMHLDALKDMLPSGSGFDAGCEILLVERDLIKIQCDFHHMTDSGYYCGWSNNVATITPAFLGFYVSVEMDSTNVDSSEFDRDFHISYIEECIFNTLDANVAIAFDKATKSFTYKVGA